MGAEPVLQVSQYQSAQSAADLVRFFKTLRSTVESHQLNIVKAKAKVDEVNAQHNCAGKDASVGKW